MQLKLRSIRSRDSHQKMATDKVVKSVYLPIETWKELFTEAQTREISYSRLIEKTLEYELSLENPRKKALKSVDSIEFLVKDHIRKKSIREAIIIQLNIIRENISKI